MNTRHASFAIWTLLLTIAPSAVADESVGRSFVAPVGDGTLTSSAASAESGAEIRAGSENSKAYIKLGHALSDSNLFSVFALTASAPLDKKSDTTELASLDGFANAFTLELKLTRFLTNRKSVNWSEQKPFYAQLNQTIAKGALGKGDVKSIEEGEKLDVDSNNILKYAPELSPKFESLSRDRSKWDMTWGGSATVGYQSYSYLTPPTLAKDSAEKVPWGAKVFWGFVPGSDDTLITFSFEYQSAFKDADTKTIVLPPDANGVQEAKTGPIGPPKSDHKRLAALEVRRLIGFPSAEKPIGVDLKISYDLEDHTLGVDMPVWIIRDNKGNLTGGLTFGWTEKDDKFTVGVIVGGAFGFF